jgi:hypothetical protein
MFFHFTHQEFCFLLTGKPLLNPATMAGFSVYKKSGEDETIVPTALCFLVIIDIL